MGADIGPRSPEQRGIRRAAVAAGLGALALDHLLLDQIAGHLLVELEEKPLASRRTSARWSALAGSSRRSFSAKPRVSSRYSEIAQAPEIGGPSCSTSTGSVPAGLSSRNSCRRSQTRSSTSSGVDLAFAEHQPHEARLDRERMVVERDHAVSRVTVAEAVGGFGGRRW